VSFRAPSLAGVHKLSKTNPTHKLAVDETSAAGPPEQEESIRFPTDATPSATKVVEGVYTIHDEKGQFGRGMFVVATVIELYLIDCV